jgi:ribose 1,5-bisphosphokinase PhnN
MGTRKAGWFKQQRNYQVAAVNRGKRQKMKVARRYASHLHPIPVTPAQAGVQAMRMDSRLRGNDGTIAQRATLIQQPKPINQPQVTKS